MIEAQPKTAAANIRLRQRRHDCGIGVWGQSCIGMEKQQDIALRSRSTVVHLVCPPAWRMKQGDTRAHRERKRGITAAAIDHNYLNRALKICDIGKRLINDRGFV